MKEIRPCSPHPTAVRVSCVECSERTSRAEWIYSDAAQRCCRMALAAASRAPRRWMLGCEEGLAAAPGLRVPKTGCPRWTEDPSFSGSPRGSQKQSWDLGAFRLSTRVSVQHSRGTGEPAFVGIWSSEEGVRPAPGSGVSQMMPLTSDRPLPADRGR